MRTSEADTRSESAEAGPLRGALIALAGIGAGASIFLGFGFYDLGVWGWIGLAALALLAGLAVAAPAVPRGPALAAAAGLAGLWLWSLLSTRWAESADQALLDADRWLVYAAFFGCLLLLLRGRGLDRLLLGAAAAPVVLTAAYMLVKMAAGDGAGLFLANRLNEPLAYVNGLAGYMLIAFWPAVAAAERARSPVAAGAALAAATALAGLALLTQSRGAVAGLLLSAVVLMVLVPGRTQRGWALLAAAAGVAVCVPAFGDVTANLPPGVPAPDDDSIATAARWLLAASVLVGVVWGAIRAATSAREDWGRSASIALAAIAVIGLVAVSIPPSKRIDQISDQYETFSELGGNDGQGSRLTSGGGNRKDYWSVSLDQFSDDPLKGIGAGNYDVTYFRDRETTENVRNPHSIELQVMGELGLVGTAFLLLLIGGGSWALVARSRGAPDAAEAGVLVAAGGVFFVWLGQTSVDWLHLIPGLTGIALCGLAVLVAPFAREPADPRRGRAPRAAVAGVAAALAALSISLPLLADARVSDGLAVLQDDPEEAVVKAREALDLNDESLAAYQLEAAGLAKLGDYEGARDALLEATRREPTDYVPWALLGDLAVRRGDLDAAARFYARASELNPREEALPRFAKDPAAARAQLDDG